MRQYRLWIGMALMGTLVAATVEAAEGPPVTDPVEQAMVQHRVHPALYKLGRGLANVVTGWMEVPYNIQSHYYYKDPVSSSLGGAMIGLAKGVARMAVGAYEVVTFCLPYPADFMPVLPPLEPFRSREKPLGSPS